MEKKSSLITKKKKPKKVIKPKEIKYTEENSIPTSSESEEAIKERIKFNSLLPRELLPKEKWALTLKQEEFCQRYSGHKWNTFGNATRSYIEVYGVNQMTGETVWPRMLGNVRVLERINELLDEMNKDDVMDRQIVKVALQDSELWSKVSALRLYNEIKWRIKNKLEVWADQELRDIWKNIINKNTD